MVGSDDTLYIISPDKVKRTSARNFGKQESTATVNGRYFEDSKMGVDRTRDDGWISVIGQRGKTVTVVDYWMGK